MMKKLFLPAFLVFVSVAVFAQNDLKNEIISFTDTTELIIRNGRKLLVDKIITGDYKAATATLNYLKETVDDKYVILYPAEEIMFSLATRNFELFLYDAENYKSLMQGKVRAFQLEPISDDINQYLSTEIGFIADDLKNGGLSVADKEFIQLYIRYYMNEDPSTLYKAIKTYNKNYPENKYKDFLKELQQLTTTGRMSFCFGYGNEFLNGEISDAFNDRLNCMYVEIDGFVNQLYLSVFVGGSIGNNVVSNFDMPIKKTDLIHLAGEKVSSLKYGLKIGHSVYSNKIVNLYPYVSIGGFKMMSESQVVDKDASEIKNTLTNSFYSGVGTSCDFVIKKWTPKHVYDPGGLLFIRPSIGYDRFFSSRQYTSGAEFYFSFTVGASLGGM